MRIVGAGPGRTILRRSFWKSVRISPRFSCAQGHDDGVGAIDRIQVFRVELFDRETLQEHGGREHVAVAAIHHRLGRVDIGQASVVIAVSAAHRGAAMDACREAIDTLKQTVPIWKKEVFEGGEEWIGREGT